MSALFLSRARLKRDPALDVLAAQLLPEPGGARAHAAHRLIWSLFAGEPDAERSFLFRELRPGGLRPHGAEFMILSSRRPATDSPILDIETQDFSPRLSVGDRLHFSLRANATVAHKKEGGKATRSDLVMHALSRIPRAERHEHRAAVLGREGRRWLTAQGERHGFRLAEPDDDADATLRTDGYDVWRFPRLGRDGRIAVFDAEGVLEVTEPSAFLAQLVKGFGRARSFGCGLMLIRRA